jgi:hypothetical protein
VPVPTASTVRRALDIVLPDNRALVSVLWDRDGIWTAAAIRRRAGEIDLVAGPDLITKWAGPLGGDWRRDYRIIVDAVDRAVAPVHLGIFAEARTVRSLLRSSEPGAWTRATATREVIVHPTPAYVGMALADDAMHAVAKQSARFLGGIDFMATIGPLSDYVRGRVREIASVSATLGFDPLKALAQVLRREPHTATGDRPSTS